MKPEVIEECAGVARRLQDYAMLDLDVLRGIISDPLNAVAFQHDLSLGRAAIEALLKELPK